MKTASCGWRPVARAGALAGLALVTACARVMVPPHLGGLARERVVVGEHAAKMIAAMHGKSVAPRDSAIAEYGTRGELRLYLSRYRDRDEAREVLARMVNRMASGATPFSPPSSQGAMQGRYLTFGPGGHNVLWVAGATLYWLQGGAGNIERAFPELPAPAAGTWT
jgi:hypothetical protein